MRKVRVGLNNFQFGEVSESTLMRTDTAIYGSSAQRIENFSLLAEGGVRRRHGMRNMVNVSDVTYDSAVRMKARLEEFVFSDDERYLVLFEDAKVRVYQVNASTLTLAETITADTDAAALPFNEDYLHEYTFTQYGDVMFICHPLFMPRMLLRTSLTDFEITPYSFDQSVDGSFTHQPYAAFQGVGETLTPSASTHATGATITMTSSVNYFDTTGSLTGSDYLDSLHVGVILVYGDSEFQIDSVQSATQATGTILTTFNDGTDLIPLLRTRLSVLNPLRTLEDLEYIEVTHLAHGLDVGDSITVHHASTVGGFAPEDINGARTIIEILDENTYTIESEAPAGGRSGYDGLADSSEDGGGWVYISSDAPTTSWGEQSFSAMRGYPGACAFHENRLVLAGSIDQPDTIWFSKSGQFFNFDVGDAYDADAITLVAATGDVSEVRAVVSNRDLQIFTATSELYVPTYLNQAITPSNAQIRRQTPFGSTFVSPKPLDGATLFVQPGGKVIREYVYSDEQSAYVGTAVSTIASHLLNDPVDLSVIHGAFEEAESYAAFVMADGSMASFGSNRAEKRAGWTRITSADDSSGFCSVASIDERMFALVWEHGTTTGNVDQEQLYIVEFDSDYYLDISLQAAPASGDYVELGGAFSDGETVHAIGYASGSTVPVHLGTFLVESYDTGGSVYSTRAVVTGSFGSYATVEVGLKPTVQLITNPIDADIGLGPETGNKRGVSSAVLDLRNTRSVSVNGWPYNPSTEYDGKKEFFLLGYSRDTEISISQDEPLDLQLNGLIAELIV